MSRSSASVSVVEVLGGTVPLLLGIFFALQVIRRGWDQKVTNYLVELREPRGGTPSRVLEFSAIQGGSKNLLWLSRVAHFRFSRAAAIYVKTSGFGSWT